ncbi:MAG TPA: hypothetical protein VF516_00195 [Kofleriaceae bacterium]
MTTPLLPRLANNELVALAWIRDIVSVYNVALGTTLQGPDPDTQVLSWGDTGFVTASTVGGTPNGTVPLREPVMEILCHATNPGKSRPPWGRANAIAETIIEAARSINWGDTQRPVTLPTGYPAVRVGDGSALTEPERRRSDEANYAIFGFTLSVSWLAL